MSLCVKGEVCRDGQTNCFLVVVSYTTKTFSGIPGAIGEFKDFVREQVIICLQNSLFPPQSGQSLTLVSKNGDYPRKEYIGWDGIVTLIGWHIKVEDEDKVPAMATG